jgi:hypothetical protein
VGDLGPDDQVFPPTLIEKRLPDGTCVAHSVSVQYLMTADGVTVRTVELVTAEGVTVRYAVTSDGLQVSCRSLEGCGCGD